MLINWFTVGAQVVNFLILVWLMRRYLYRPIIAAIDARATAVAAVLAGADKKMVSATEQLSAYQQKVKAFDDDQVRHKAEVESQLKTERTAAMQSIQDDARTAREAGAADLRRQQSEFAGQLGQLVESQVFAIARKTMTDLADANLEHQMVAMFIRQLASLDAASHQGLSDALSHSPSSALLTSSFELAEADRALLRNAVSVLAGASITPAFATSAANVCGIELSCAGQRAAWTITDYLDGLSEKSTELLDQNFAIAKAVSPEPAAGEVATAVNQAASAPQAVVT